MITQYFGFTQNPFSRNIPVKEMFVWSYFENLNMRLHFFIKEGGIFLLTGSIGSGKSTALKYFAKGIDGNRYRIVYLAAIFDTKKDFYKTLLAHFGVTPSHYTGDCRNMIKKHLMDMKVIKKTTPIVIIDEAQNLPGFILEEIRLLSNFDFDSESPALFILSGHRLLQQRISLHENEALRQRVTMKFHLQPLSLEETCGYISHRLEKSGSTSSIFSDSVLGKIHEVSAGVPRMINKICHDLLLAAVISEKKVIDEYLFEQTKNEWE